MECLGKMGIMYERELELLEQKLQIKADPEKVLELERKFVEQKTTYEMKCKKKKQLELRIKELEKALERASKLKASEFAEHEEKRLLKEMNNDYEKKIKLEQKVFKDNDVILFKEKKIMEISGQVEKLEIELGELRAIAQNNAGPQNKITISSAPLINKAQLLEQQKALQKEISEFKAKKSVEVSEQMKLLSQLKQQYQTLFHNNKLNSHRILEQNRLAKPAKVRHSSVLTPRITSNNHRAEKLLKYKRMKLKNAKSVVPVVESKGFSDVEQGVQTIDVLKQTFSQ